MWGTFPLVREYLDGVAASSPWEARLGREEFDREVHAYSPAYSRAALSEITTLADHVVFNSLGQWENLGSLVTAAKRSISPGLRINPEHSEVEVALYDPCAPGSRLGVRAQDMDDAKLQGIEGLHFHTLCELGADALRRTLAEVEKKFGAWLSRMRWINLGGGHHITKQGYDVDLLVSLIRKFAAKYDVEIYLEPGEAVALNAGVFVSRVLDVVAGDQATVPPIAILDCSATAHMPDVLEMPYRPRIHGAGEPGTLPYTYRLGGLSCLAGDVIGDYSFGHELKPGDCLVFHDMAHYTMVKNTTFNGVQLPDIATYDAHHDEIRVVRRFSYVDYRDRLS